MNLQKQIEAKLHAEHKEFKLQGDWLKVSCINPEHSDSNPSAGININSGIFNCFSCGYKTMYLESTDIDPEYARSAMYSSIIESMDVEEEPKGTLIMPKVHHYITHSLRGINANLIQELGIYYCTTGKLKGRIIFPINNSYGELVSYSSWLPPKGLIEPYVEPDERFKDQKYVHAYGFKSQDTVYPLDQIWNANIVTYGTSLHLTEGVWDALTLLQDGIPAVCNFGLAPPTPKKVGEVFALGCTEIINAFDNDAKGKEGWHRIKEEWRKYIPIGRPTQIIKDLLVSGYKDFNERLLHVEITT